MRRPPNPKPAPAPTPDEPVEAICPDFIFRAWCRARTRSAPNALAWTAEPVLFADFGRFVRAAGLSLDLDAERFAGLLLASRTQHRQMPARRDGCGAAYLTCWDRQLLPAIRVAA